MKDRDGNDLAPGQRIEIEHRFVQGAVEETETIYGEVERLGRWAVVAKVPNAGVIPVFSPKRVRVIT